MDYLRRCFNARFEERMAESRRLLAPFALCLLLFAGIIGLNLGWTAAALWAAAGLAMTGWSHLALAPPPTGVRSLLSGCNCVATVFANGVLWSAAAAMFWTADGPGFRIMAIILLATLLILNQGYAFRSGVLAATGQLPLLATLCLLPLAAGYGVAITVSIALTLAVAALFLVDDVRRNTANARALLEAERRASEANEAKSAFLAMMSHELRTPMNGVLGMAHALSLTSLDPRQAAHVNMLLRSGDGLMTILNEILDVSKIEAGKLELERIDFDLHELGQTVHDLWSDVASAKGVGLAYDLAPGTPQWVRGDPTRLRQVMLNLVSNAVKFTREGEVRLTLAGVVEDGLAAIQIEVRDTGPGLSEAQQARLFQSFVQADASTTRQYGGTGLGLAICKQLVGLMAGEIGVCSQPGDGATFRVSLRLPLAAPITRSALAAPVADVAGLRVLVADDNEINRMVVATILEAVGAVVSLAEDGAQALEALAGGTFDAVLMDVHMPRMDGVEALGRVRRGAAGPADIPVVALTADAMQGADANLLALGFDRVVSKPISPSDLIAALEAVRTGPASAKVSAA